MEIILKLPKELPPKTKIVRIIDESALRGSLDKKLKFSSTDSLKDKQENKIFLENGGSTINCNNMFISCWSILDKTQPPPTRSWWDDKLG